MDSISVTSTSAPLQAHGITFGYREQAILQQLDFHAIAGKLTILIGANGCGKSTLLKLLARIYSPKQGVVLLNGQAIHQLATKQVAKQLGLLPQGPAAPEGLTVRELVSQGRFPHQALLRQWTSEDEAAVGWAMNIANVTKFADRLIDDLSGGQRQRCWIAMVLAQQTDVVLFDEPTTFLDLKVQLDLMTLLKNLAHQQGRTVVVVLHELNLAAAFADQLIMMKSGAIVAQGTPKSVFTAANLKSVFDLDAHVIDDPETRTQICVPIIGEQQHRSEQTNAQRPRAVSL